MVKTKDACELLDADHVAVKHLFVEYARLATPAAAAETRQTRRKIARTICSLLTVHAQIEEDIFYPALRDAAPETAVQLDEAMAEHQQAKDMISRIEAMGEADVAMDKLVADLNRAIERHVKEERDELFPKARTAKDLDLSALGEQLHERQQELQ
ncbi:hemerythrin domain-containing protein [Ramlibacter tataouinensis]|uniref:hemerythrin domain-containing protein n=1 Tax=Ramlibacter tataouinensis TaxID=94132 RepID=UPI0022F3D9E8|nr:hemerythrin domain-containing protein [Ramlibacter tataouinensis]WBY02904.1 hemerythrin domain-containing protein [Ramlibacter tataouinensis]